MRYAILALSLGCSSSEFSIADGADAADTGTFDTAADDTSTAPPDTGMTETPPPDAMLPPCSELAPNPAIVFVDRRTTRKGKGTSDCPFANIKDAVAAVAGLASGTGKHTISVAGGAPGTPLVYDEPLLVLKNQMSLVGEGADRVTITGGGACDDTTQCMVIMEGGSTLEGVKLDAKSQARVPLAIAPGPFAFVSVKATTITGTRDEKSPGIYINGKSGFAEIGPDVKVIDNGGVGLAVHDIGNLKITGTAALPNQFSRNLVGIYVAGGRLEVAGPTEAVKNKSAGLALAAPGRTHVIDGLTATDNGGAGVVADLGSGLKLRRSRLVRNDIGLVFRYSGANELDLGAMFDPGGNTFAGADKNLRAGICLPAARVGTPPARNNTFTACPPTMSSMAEAGDACDKVSGSYHDVWFASAVTGDTAPPLDLTNCEKPK